MNDVEYKRHEKAFLKVRRDAINEKPLTIRRVYTLRKADAVLTIDEPKYPLFVPPPDNVLVGWKRFKS